MTTKTKHAATKLVRLSTTDIWLLKAARRLHASARPRREAAAAVDALRSLLDWLPKGDNNIHAHLSSATEQLAAQVAMVEDAAQKARLQIEKLPTFHPQLFRKCLRRFRAEAKQRTRSARRAA